jgi:hypothetical protein
MSIEVSGEKGGKVREGGRKGEKFSEKEYK